MTNGIVNVYKEAGYTSHDVVACVRRIFGQKKVGHTGTLDPAAEGVLPVCLGPSTKVCGLLTDQDKTYEAVMRLGVRTDTQDLTGRILSECGTIPAPGEVRAAVLSFSGAYDQVPPMYSALKVRGKKLYELAREGTQIERQPRRVIIRSIELLSMDLPDVKLRVTCSKGTYIRTLCDDIGEKLGCGAAMASLLRTRVGAFDLADACRIGKLRAAKEAGTLDGYVCSPDRLFPDLPAVRFSEEARRAARNGNRIPAVQTDAAQPASSGMRVRMYDPDGVFYGIYEADAWAAFRPVKILTDLSQ